MNIGSILGGLSGSRRGYGYGRRGRARTGGFGGGFGMGRTALLGSLAMYGLRAYRNRKGRVGTSSDLGAQQPGGIPTRIP